MESKPHTGKSLKMAADWNARNAHDDAVRQCVQSRRPHVAVVGAGLAGLRCAEGLLKEGLKVTLFEARDRVGGRVGSEKAHQGSYALSLGL